MGKVRKPIIGVIYKGVDVTSDITYFLLNFRYRDKINGDSPDLEIELEDREKIWQKEWFPTTGDAISAIFQYEGEENKLEANNFEIDLLDFSFDNRNGDRLRIGAQQTPFSKNLREKRSQEYEKMTLLQIIQSVASRQGLKVVGTVFDITFERITQNEESDLEFLTRLGSDYGQLFKIEGEKLIFYNYFQLNGQPSEFTINRKDIKYFRASKKLSGIYNSVKVVYEGVNGEPVIGGVIKANPPNNSKDVLTINDRVENDFQALAKAQEKLRQANADEYSGDLTVEGEYRYIAGINFTIEGFGAFNGVWQIQEVEHTFTRDGWLSSMKIYKVG
ncbi:phage late control D family protein [Geminocystis sp. NIES-3709]|uniref:phage late control D family protein n=1 Tax=Geminocystis sp. NIES-3709 TaxID=1617448 RepID=UPI0005FCAB91|nr:hypothetical protein [Geminocystis sp. NIES-3709]BAQ65516.1 probable bacteriophage regulatory protein [Geminocystis sp. NIES-3709]